MEAKSRELFKEGYARLSDANRELYKPEEDVVSYLVCKNAQFAVESYLKGYLVKNNVELDSFKSLNDLYNACCEINPRFKKVNLGEFNCGDIKLENARYCNEVTKVSHCFKAANELDTFLREEKVIQ